MKRIVIVYELPQRELENDLLIKSYLELKGYECDVVKFPFHDHQKLKRKYKNKVDVILVHSLYDDSVINNLVYEAFGTVPYIINVQVEQLTTNRVEEDIAAYGHPKGMAVNAYHICWGKKIKLNLTRCGIKEEKLLLTGPVQMDFLRPEFNCYYLEKKEICKQYNIQNDQKIALFISSFSYVGLPEYARKSLRSKIGDERFSRFEALSTNTYEEIISWFEHYLEKSVDTVIVYRPHPAERLSEQIRELANKNPNRFKIISDYSVKQWIVAADNIWSWYSTSVAEAYYAKKPVIILRPVHIEYDDEVVILNDSTFVTNENDFIQFADRLSECSLSDEVMNQYFDVDDMHPSFIRIGNAIDQILNKKVEPFPWEKFDTKHYKRMNKLKARKRIINSLYIKAFSVLIKNERYKKLTLPSKLQKRISAYKRDLDREKNIDTEINRIMGNIPFFKRIVKEFEDE